MDNTKINKSVIPFLIALGVICLNFPLVIILYFLAPDNLPNYLIPIAGIECVGIGFTIMCVDIFGERKKRLQCDRCVGKIVKRTMQETKTGDWIKSIVVEYQIRDIVYTTNPPIGISGILAPLIMKIPITVYFDRNDPTKAYITPWPVYACGYLFTFCGIFIIIMKLIGKF